MASDNQTRRQMAGIFIVLLCAGCGGDGGGGGGNPVTAPRLGSLRVSVQTSGGDLDENGYRVVVGSEPGPPISVNQSLLISDLTPGTHTVALGDLAANCTIAGAHPLSVTVAPGSPAEVGFTVNCDATGIEVRIRTSGPDNPIGYELTVKDVPWLSHPSVIPPNGSQMVTRLTPGTYSLALGNIAENCSIVGARERTVTVANRTVTPVLFEITCVALMRVEKIAYTVGTQIVLANVDGSGAVDLRAGRYPAWSADGTRLAFEDAACYADYYEICFGGIVIVDPEARKVTIPSAGKGGTQPAWAPAGDLIAFSCACDNPFAVSPVYAIYTMKLDGSAAMRLSLAGVLSASNPAWSPDGQRIAFTCIVDNNNDICTSNANGTGVVRLTSDPAVDTDPQWSPDGRRIAFSRHLDRLRVVLMSADGGAVTEISEGWEPAWSRDGGSLVYAREDGLFRIDTNGSNSVRLTSGNHYAPAWRPKSNP